MTRHKTHLALAVLALIVGCKRPVATTEYDASKARQTLVAALDAWKQAQAGQLAKRQPPIRFVDDDLRSGWYLMDFQVRQSTELIGPFKDVPTMLMLRDRKGRTINKRVTYQVTLQPALAVLRSD